jgi:hypothetical protein
MSISKKLKISQLEPFKKLGFVIVTLHKNVANMITNMTTFVVVKDIYNYHDYNAYIWTCRKGH